MIRIATIEEVRTIEAEADQTGYSYDQMMDQAGRAVADRAVAMLAGIEEPRVTVLVGAGNNGGDGLVAGLYLAQDLPEAEVRFYLLTERDDAFVTTAQEAGLFIAKASDDHDKRVLRNMVASADLVIDALFGIGVRLPIKGEAQQVLRHAGQEIRIRQQKHMSPEHFVLAEMPSSTQASKIQVLAVDCPSGMDCNTGECDQWMIAADETITFIAAKPGMFMYPAAGSVGQVVVAPIGIPDTIDASNKLTKHVIDADLIRDLLPDRTPDSHKGTYGRALIVAGSSNYIGAPALSAEGAYRAGAGLVTVASASPVITALAGTLREVTWLMLPHDMGVIATDANAILLKNLERVQAMLIGPGLGTEKTTREFLQTLLNTSQNKQYSNKRRRLGFGQVVEDADDDTEGNTVTLPPLVIDADGLNLLAEIPDWHTLLPEDTIITPHPGEMARLCELDTQAVQKNRWQLALDKAQEWGVIVLLKGAYTVIASPSGDCAVLPFAVDALATAGTGDVLAGLIVGLRAQGISAWDAVRIGAFVHAMSGQLLSDRTSSRSIIAGDLFWQIGEVFQQLEC